jgi:hypothetical protein
MPDTADRFIATGGPQQGGAGFATGVPPIGVNIGVYGGSSPFASHPPDQLQLPLEERGVGVLGVSEDFGPEGAPVTGDGIGVQGVSHRGVGVDGVCTDLHPRSDAHEGVPPLRNVERRLAEGTGVRGLSTAVGVHGYGSSDPVGIPLGVSIRPGTGVLGEGQHAGVSGAGGQVGVRGDGGIGVSGVSYVGNPGVVGVSLDRDLGGHPDNPVGATGSGDGIAGGSGTGSGVSGRSDSGAGVTGTSQSGSGGVFSGGAAAIRLSPSQNAGPPASPGEQGDMVVDRDGLLWFCQTPGTWRQIAFA